MRPERTFPAKPVACWPALDGGSHFHRRAARLGRWRAWALIAFLPFALPSRAQQGVVTLGIQAKPVIPFNFFDPLTVLEAPSLSGSVELTGGFAFGMMVRAGITKSISFETGINQINRRFDVSIANDTSGYTDADRLRYIGYEIPALAMVYIRLGERSWMNNAIGFSLDMYPSDAERVLKEARAYMARKDWVQLGVVGNIGVEYRTRKSGWFYLGATYHRPFGDMATAELTWYDRSNFPTTIFAGVDGSYLTADIRYFFHSDPERVRERRARKDE